MAFLNRAKVRSAIYQLAVLALVLWLAVEFVLNASQNLQVRNQHFGVGFLKDPAGFDVSQTLIAYSEQDSYGRVFLVGLLNTLLVSGVGIVLATVLGFAIGLARLSPNWLLARLAGGYVELVRNLPLLFQILFWYMAIFLALPGPRQSFGLGLQPVLLWAADRLDWVARMGGPTSPEQMLRGLAEQVGPPAVYLNSRGLFLPKAIFQEGSGVVLAVLPLALLAALAVGIWARRRQAATGRQFPVWRTGFALVLGLPALAFVAAGFPVAFEQPVLRGFNFVGGVRIIPEFTALLVALATYTAAFIAEVVRAGVLAIHKGQSEAALALGLRRGQLLRLVIVPQAMRVIVPPLTNQYLNLTKNSSLAVAIGYPDLVAVFAGTALNQTHRAIEIIAITMGVYLLISLVTSLAMNIYNHRIRLKER